MRVGGAWVDTRTEGEVDDARWLSGGVKGHIGNEFACGVMEASQDR
jgi:hypothetical protein